MCMNYEHLISLDVWTSQILFCVFSLPYLRFLFFCVKKIHPPKPLDPPLDPTEAARDVGEAALDQTEAELLDNEAKSLDANVAESTAARETQGKSTGKQNQGGLENGRRGWVLPNFWWLKMFFFENGYPEDGEMIWIWRIFFGWVEFNN